MDKYEYLIAAIQLGFLAFVFLILFVVFLIKSIVRGKRIKELETKLKEASRPVNMGQMPIMPMGMPMMQMPYQYPAQPVPQMTMQQTAAPKTSSDVSEPKPAPVVAAQSATAPAPAAAVQPAPAPAPVVAAQPAPAPAPQQAYAPAPSWAMPPAAAQMQRAEMPTYTREDHREKPKREKFFSSINITFGIGVLLLTIVGATFMTGSWSWMTEEIRAISLVVLVFIVYGMSFLAGKILKLQQTGFALYSLASLLGPIVVVGMGTFNLLGPGFSFDYGTGWLVATVASLILLVTSIGGRFLFHEKVQTNIYRCTIYFSLTWLVVFLSGQIGQSVEEINEWSMICLGLATLALAFRIIAITPLFEDEPFFKVYSEVITYIPAVLLSVTALLSNGAVFGATIVEFAAMILLAKFAKNREWVKYLTPLVGMEIVVAWIVFADKTGDIYLMTSILMVIFVVVYAVHKALKLSTLFSDIGLAVTLGCLTSIMAFEKAPVMGAVASFLSLALIVFELMLEPVIAKIESLPQGIFRKELPMPAQVIMSIVGAVFYYVGITLIYLVPEENAIPANLYFTILALIPAVASIVLRFTWRDDIKIKAAGFTMAVVSVIAGFFSIFSYENASSLGTVLCSRIYICAWLLTLAVMVLSVCFIVKPIKEKLLSVGAMFWVSVCINALAIGVFLMIDYNAQAVWRIKDIPGSFIPLVRQIAALTFMGLNIACLAAAFFVKRKGKGMLAKYAFGLKFFFCGFAMTWFTYSWYLFGSTWTLLIVAVIFAVLLSLLDCEFFAALPVIAGEIAVISELNKLGLDDVTNVVLIILTVLVAAAGRLVFRKNVITSKAADYLSLTSFVFLFGLKYADYVPMMVLLAIALLVMNFAGRTKIPVRVLLSIFAGFVCLAVIAQPFFDLPEVIALEYDIVLLLGTLMLIWKLIKPAPDNVLKYIWFTGVALSLVAEGISAAVTGETLDLIVVGTASFGIFIYAFLRRNRLWFILGIVSMVSVAVYLSVAFWSSLVWLIYLLIAGSILIVMAAVNEWGKRHNKDGNKKRFFQEWTW